MLLATGSALAKEAKKSTKSKAAPPKPKVTASPSPTPTTPPAPVPAPEELKPKVETLLKPKSIKRVVEDFDVITNSEWVSAESKTLEHSDDDDFAFVNAVLIRTPLSYARPKIMDWSLYPKMSSAIKKFEYDPATQVIEIEGEASGLRMHSWVKVDPTYTDLIRYEIIKGDMRGFKVQAYLWDREGKTLAVAKGLWPHAKQSLPAFVRLLFKPVSEVVLGVATKNFRGYIEEEYKKQKSQ